MKLPDELQFMANARKPQKRTTAPHGWAPLYPYRATSGVGLAAARRLAQGGAHLVLVCRNPDKAAAVKAELEQEHHTMLIW